MINIWHLILNLFSIDSLFEVTPSSAGDYLFLTIFFAALIIGSIVSAILKIKANRLLKKFYGNCYGLLLTMGLIGLLLIFFRFEAVPYLASRLAILIWFLVFVLWLGNILIYRFVVYPKAIQANIAKEKFEKYLPKKKKPPVESKK